VVENREVEFELARVGITPMEHATGNRAGFELGQFGGRAGALQVEGLLAPLLQAPHLGLVLLALKTRARTQFRLLKRGRVRLLATLEVTGSLAA
jgi:hypothetical protein